MSTRLKNNIGGRGSQRSRFFLVRCVVVFLFSILAARLVYVQCVLRTELQSRANKQFSSLVKNTESRGNILDANGQILTELTQIYSCFVDPSLLKRNSVIPRKLAHVLGINEKGLAEKIRKTKGSFLWVKRDVAPNLVREIKDQKWNGVGFKTELRRHYPQGPLASHVLGIVGTERHGLSGVERSFDKVLNLESSNSNEAVRSTDLPQGHLQLTIDAFIQRVAERELAWGVEKTGAKRGSVIVQNPWTGEIVAAASWPPLSLDPENPPASEEMRIPVLVDVFEPGSTYKVVTAAAAIEEQLVSDKEYFSGENGKWKVYQITINDHEPLQKMNFEDIMVHSSNIGTSKIADRIGTQRMYQYSRLFGFGVFPGSGIGVEAKGVLRSPNQWSGVSKYTVSFGQEVGVTAVQLVGAYSAIANGGILMEPRFLKSILSDDGNVLWKPSFAEVRRVFSKGTSEKLINLLSKVVEKGTGINAQVQWDSSMKVAGKTGTAQKYDNKRKRYHETLTLVSFCGFFPANDPRFTMVVILDEPEGRRWGGLDAAPVFRRIAEQLSPRIPSLSRPDPAVVKRWDQKAQPRDL